MADITIAKTQDSRLIHDIVYDNSIQTGSHGKTYRISITYGPLDFTLDTNIFTTTHIIEATWAMHPHIGH